MVQITSMPAQIPRTGRLVSFSQEKAPGSARKAVSARGVPQSMTASACEKVWIVQATEMHRNNVITRMAHNSGNRPDKLVESQRTIPITEIDQKDHLPTSLAWIMR